MSNLVSVELRDGIAVLHISNGPMNSLSQGLRAELYAQLTSLAADPKVLGIVLAGQGAGFSSGLDLAELEADPLTPTVQELCLCVEMLAKPVVAALHGSVLGAGFDLALAAHARIVRIGAKAGFPTLAMGLMPAGGATQRLPRLIGSANALKTLNNPRLFPLDGPPLKGVADLLVPDNPVAAAVSYLRVQLDHPGSLIPTQDRRDGVQNPMEFFSAVAEAREALSGRITPTEDKITDCVEACLLLPFASGLAFEDAAAEECRHSDYSKGLRHTHMAQRRAANFPDLVGQHPAPIRKVGVIGGGLNAASIAALVLAKGLSVVLFERDDQKVAEATDRISTTLEALMLGRDSAEAWSRLTATSDLEALSDVDMAIESVAENLNSKTQVFAALDHVLPKDALRVTNASLVPIDPLASVTDRPEQLLGLHFHLPVTHSPIVEVLPGSLTSAASIATAVVFVTALERVPVRCGTGGGTLGEPMMAAMRDAAWALVLQGENPYDIDLALQGFGLRNGVFKTIDFLGMDITLKRLNLLHKNSNYPNQHRNLLHRMIAHDRMGRRDKLGFYRWSEDGQTQQDAGLQTVLPEVNWGKRSAPAEHIVRNIIAAMANQGARLLREDSALRPSDIDVVMVLAHGFPRHQGGPMKAADMLGLFSILQELRRHADVDSTLFAPEPGIATLVKNGENFDVLNRIGRKRRKIPA